MILYEFWEGATMASIPKRNPYSAECLVAALLACVCGATLNGQTNMGTITGLVSDKTEAVLPGIAVTAKNMATGAEAATVTSATGNYLIPNLPVGSYRINVSHAGFKGWSRSGIALSAGDNIRVDAVLE